jgi:hypothetical protein
MCERIEKKYVLGTVFGIAVWLKKAGIWNVAVDTNIEIISRDNHFPLHHHLHTSTIRNHEAAFLLSRSSSE